MYFIREDWKLDSLVLDGAGNVGIGTSKPSAKLTIAGVDSGQIGLEVVGKVGNSHIPYSNGCVYLTTNIAEGNNGNFVFRAYDGSKYKNILIIDGTRGYIQQEEWKAAAFESKWVNWGDSYNPAGYFKDSLGIVHLRGLVKSGEVGGNATIFTLPAGYRPKKRELRIVCTNADTSGRVDIETNGRVIPQGNINSVWVSLDGITFRAA
jgi:hypothetical protein